MKKQIFIYPAVILVILIGLSSLKSFEKKGAILEKIDMPDNVKAVIDNKCYGCHNAESQNEKAKEKMQWDQLDQLSKAKQVSTFSDIEEVLDEGKMPPEKFLEKKPEMKLTDEEKQILKDWAVATSEKLLN
jgi:uncharacterized membrane protein